MGYYGYVSVVLTILHTWEEIHWDLLKYLNKVSGAKIARDTGWFFIGLVTPVLAIAAAHYGYWSVLVGMRLGDAIFTHGLPQIFVQERNPGRVTALLYLGEAALISFMTDVPNLDLFIGMFPFILLWPLLWSNGQ
jgi:hypothetical protein